MNRILFFLIFINLFVGCLPEENQLRELDTDDAAIVDDNESTDSDDESSEENEIETVHWYHQNNYSKSLTLDYQNQLASYLRGIDVHAFLLGGQNMAGTYCVVVDFQVSNTVIPNQLRMRAIPDSFDNIGSGSSEKYLRVDSHDQNANSLCNKPIETFNGSWSQEVPSATTAFKTESVCTNCLNLITSNSVKIYKIVDSHLGGANNVLIEIPAGEVSYSELAFRIDMNNNSNSNPNGSCTNAYCSVLGYDCCSQGQCVNEKQVKLSGASIDPTGYAIAQLQEVSNPNWYLDYPQYYYSCLESPPTDDPSDDTSSDPEAEALERLNALIEDYECITELKENALSNPFHADPYNWTPGDYSECNVTSGSDDMFYENVMKRMYTNCGCSQTTLANMVAHCPNYEYTASMNSAEEVTSVTCYTPPVDTGPLPFQDLDLHVNSRSAPHRFFNEDGVEIDLDNIDNTLANTTQEGTTFSYLDNEKLLPNNGSFNMNAIIGQMDVNLTQARPAKVLNVEFDSVYSINTVSGQYTNCPQCAKDSWFQNFSSSPITQYGVGLESIGYTTSRDDWGNNTTLGNYEDTIFGRACWVPPTMLPYSHNPDSDVQDQRLTRLKTQAALYMNGYQRDWYGFNKGALIGSFDGVTWFAIGTGRIIRATSNKLFLAINAPFADLAQNNAHTVAIRAYDGITTGAHHDFDPNLSLSHPEQNKAGICQNNHSCETDAECIAFLGWEYSCINVNQYKTMRPNFSSNNATEVANDSFESVLPGILANGELPQGSFKRCVYRGAGAPCRKDYANIPNATKRKALTCAPNFYCASVNDPVYNTKVARYAAPLEDLLVSKNHIFGQEAKILGRPYNYVEASSSLDSDIQTNLEANFALFVDPTDPSDPATVSDMGLCRPGKSLPEYNGSMDSGSNYYPENQHQSQDTELRTDYISQIGGCNSSYYNKYRYSSCPILGKDGNYLNLSDSVTYAALSSDDKYELYPDMVSTLDEVLISLSNSQNSCGLESIVNTASIGPGITADTLSTDSAFKNIEGKILTSSSANVETTITRDACLRKAGSFCHTDLDCSPSKLHAAQVGLFPQEYYGNEAEQKYWEENLICGQATKRPNIGDADFNSYDPLKNRCCREVGSDITMYSESDPAHPTLDIQTNIFGGNNPTEVRRYSRYSSLEWSGGITFDTINNVWKASGAIDHDNNPSTSDRNQYNQVSARTTDSDDVDGIIDIIESGQWRTVAHTAKRTCCGGGWIRKFADGTNKWDENRLSLTTSNFKCLNYRNPVVTTDSYSEIYDLSGGGYTAAVNSLESGFQSDKGYLCTDAAQSANDRQQGACAQEQLRDSIYSFPPSFDTYATTNTMAVYSPVDFSESTFSYRIPIRADDADIQNFIPYNELPNQPTRRNLHFYLPSHVTFNPDPDMNGTDDNSNHKAYLVKSDDNNTKEECKYLGIMDLTAFTIDPTSYAQDVPGAGAIGVSNCGYLYDPSTKDFVISWKKEILPITEGESARTLAGSDTDWGLQIEFAAPGTYAFLNQPLGTINPSFNAIGTKPGSLGFYAGRLAKLELNGIPQMTYEPIYCNTDYKKLVPGIFDDSLETMDEFELAPTAFINDNSSYPHSNLFLGYSGDKTNVTSADLATPPVFSSSEFMCCTQLGESTTDSNQCCSGYAVEDEESEGETQSLICKLPDKTDLNVYFNRFVSGDGVGEHHPGGGLRDGDFDSVTGEPTSSPEVYQRIRALGEAYCESETVRRGGAFGKFGAQPTGGQANAEGEIYSIVDSASDTGESSIGGETVDVGYNQFAEGFRWNHHFYCDKE